MGRVPARSAMWHNVATARSFRRSVQNDCAAPLHSGRVIPGRKYPSVNQTVAIIMRQVTFGYVAKPRNRSFDWLKQFQPVLVVVDSWIVGRKFHAGIESQTL